MAIYSDVVVDTDSGHDPTAFVEVGEITLRSDAKFPIAAQILAVAHTRAAAEALSGVLRISSDDLGYGRQTFTVGPYTGGAPATNIGETPILPEIVPLHWKPQKGKDANKAGVLFEYSPSLPDPAAGMSIVVALLYEAGKNPTPENILDWVGHGMCHRAAGHDQIDAAAGAALATELGDLKIPGWAEALTGIKSVIMPDAFAAGEEINGYIELESTMPDFGPQKYPLGVGQNAGLGTALGHGMHSPKVPHMGMYFPTTGKTEDVTVTLNMVVVLSGASACNMSLSWI